jgi:hypothetical protein
MKACSGCFSQFPDFIDAAVGCAVYLLDVHGGALGDLDAGMAPVAGNTRFVCLQFMALARILATDVFPTPLGPAEKIGVSEPVRFKGIDQGPGDMFLADDVFEKLGTPLSGQHFISHGKPLFSAALKKPKCYRKRKKWRRERDSNPRYRFEGGTRDFQSRSFGQLGHLSAMKSASADFIMPTEYCSLILGGEGGIRTHVPRS